MNKTGQKYKKKYEKSNMVVQVPYRATFAVIQQFSDICNLRFTTFADIALNVRCACHFIFTKALNIPKFHFTIHLYIFFGF